jgi:hypothetical protein
LSPESIDNVPIPSFSVPILSLSISFPAIYISAVSIPVGSGTRTGVHSFHSPSNSLAFTMVSSSASQTTVTISSAGNAVTNSKRDTAIGASLGLIFGLIALIIGVVIY